MRAPVSSSNPYLAIAKHHGVRYGVVLMLADWLVAGGNRGPDTYWQRWTRAQLRTHPNALAIQSDVAETVERLHGRR